MLTAFNARTAVVTGAARGIGRSLMRHALAQGMNVVAADRDAATLEAVVEEENAGDRLAVTVVDVTCDKQIAALADFAYDRFGAVHLLCNNAGTSCSGAVWELDPPAWQRMLDINFFGVIRGIYHFVPRMIAAGTPGAIVNTASLAAIVSGANLGPYTASKHALLGMSEALLRDLRARGHPITVSLLCPGPVKTGILTDKLSAEDRRMYRDEAARAALVQMIEGGMDPDRVASITFDGVAAGRFWIFTHPEYLAGAKGRYEAMVGSGMID